MTLVILPGCEGEKNLELQPSPRVYMERMTSLASYHVIGRLYAPAVSVRFDKITYPCRCPGMDIN